VDGYEQATQRLAAGDLEGAARGFEDAARSAETASQAADALFSAATIYEERLGKPEQAGELYRRIVSDYPDARVALASRRRLTNLEKLGSGGPGAQALGEWKLFLQGAALLEREEAAAQARNFLSEHSSWVGRAIVHRWLADYARERGDFVEARRELELAMEHTGDQADRFSLAVQVVDIALLEGELTRAREVLSTLEALSGDQRQVLDDLSQRLGTQEGRRSWRLSALVAVTVSFALLLGSLMQLAGGGRRGMRALWPAPTEVLFMLPLAALLVAMSLAAHQSLGPAVGTISAAGLGYAWVSGAGLRIRRVGRSRVIAHALVIALGVSGSVYVAVERGQLIDQIRETVRFGPGQ